MTELDQFRDSDGLPDETPSTVPPPNFSPRPEEYLLTEEERAEYHLDAVRAEVRQRVSESVGADTTVYIKDADGQIWDSVNGQLDPGESLSLLSSEEREAKLLEQAAYDEEVRRVEEVLKPAAITRLRAEARAEFREYTQSQSREILKLRTDLAKAQATRNQELNKLKAENLMLRNDINRRKAKEQAEGNPQ